MKSNRQARQLLNMAHWVSNQFKVSGGESQQPCSKHATGRKKKAKTA